MAAQPQQPICPNEFKFELDRLFTRITAYVDARFDGVMTQMRVDRQEFLARDEALLKRVENVESGVRSLADIVMKLAEKVSGLGDKVSGLENGQPATMNLIKDLHAEAMEATNDLRQQLVDK